MIKASNLFFSNPRNLFTAFLKKIKKILWDLGKNAFLVVLILVLVNISFGEFLFYKYVFLTNIKELETPLVATKFKEDTYQLVLQKIQAREDIFNNSLQEDYSDPFN